MFPIPHFLPPFLFVTSSIGRFYNVRYRTLKGKLRDRDIKCSSPVGVAGHICPEHILNEAPSQWHKSELKFNLSSASQAPNLVVLPQSEPRSFEISPTPGGI